jgi:hypothetical protein
METGLEPQLSKLTSTQIGAIGEAIVAAGLMHASGGRISPFKPFADDDGTDLLLFDKLTKIAIPLQVKCRTGIDKGGTVQFDVRLKTFAREGSGFALAALLDGTAVQMSWLVPASKLDSVARMNSEKLTIVASPAPNSNDKFRPYRHASLTSVTGVILEAFVAGRV